MTIQLRAPWLAAILIPWLSHAAVLDPHYCANAFGAHSDSGIAKAGSAPYSAYLPQGNLSGNFGLILPQLFPHEIAPPRTYPETGVILEPKLLIGHSRTLSPEARNLPHQHIPDGAPTLFPDGRVMISGTSPRVLIYDHENNFIRGRHYRSMDLPLIRSDGTPVGREIHPYRHTPWDLVPIIYPNGECNFWGGAISPGYPNESRSLFRFRPRDSAWVQDPEDLFGSSRQTTCYDRHAYGANLLVMPDGTPYLFFERVTEVDSTGFPILTELFLQELDGSLSPVGEPYLVFGGVDQLRKLAATSRGPGRGFLVEGGRPYLLRVQNTWWVIVMFSAGNYEERYGSHYVALPLGREGEIDWTKKVDLRRPFQPALNHDGTDLEDLGQEMRDQLRLSQGPGRPALYEDQNRQLWVTTTAANHPEALQLPLHQRFRALFLAPLWSELDAEGFPRFRLRR